MTSVSLASATKKKVAQRRHQLTLRRFVDEICHEFQMSASDVVKIRRQVDSKNVVVRNDADVETLPDATFVVVIVKDSATPTFPDLRASF
jgi:hypothetical protein